MTMKKLFVMGALMLFALPSVACDQCSCGLLLGVQPKDHANNFGLQYRMRYLRGDLLVPVEETRILKHGGHSHGAPDLTEAEYVEVYSVLEARGQVWVGDRASISASIPLLKNLQAVNGAAHADLYAVGDPVLLARYALFASTTGLDTVHLRHRFTVGLGVSLPLGRTDVVQHGERLDYDLQPGTGTWDPMMSLEYVVRGTAWGGSLSAVGRYNTEAAGGHRMGHAGTFTAEVFRIIPIKHVSLLPSAGVYGEAMLEDEMHGVPDPTTGGNTLFSSLGMQVWWRQLGLQLAWQHAVINDMGAAMVPNRHRFLAGLTYSFGQE